MSIQAHMGEVWLQRVRNPALGKVDGQQQALVAFSSEKDPLPILLEAGSASWPVWMAWKLSPSKGFYSRNVQPVETEVTH